VLSRRLERARERKHSLLSRIGTEQIAAFVSSLRYVYEKYENYHGPPSPH